ncbi:hypothetical protein [Lunatimonas lonarensis]|uniref:hypothetical protein n=1 Tax=Lunatimonas lonarensis TaxID=1232681 RepID=UPI0004B2A201|nr:hypothetical protein [Lunatimonas lonarensis]
MNIYISVVFGMILLSQAVKCSNPTEGLFDSNLPALKDINEVPVDLEVPEISNEPPARGKRVKQVLEEYEDTEVYHILYLPTNWKLGKKFPVIVEYPGNGPYTNKYGDECAGIPDDTNLGYGISGGRDFVWVSLPFISLDGRQNQLKWWGDVDASVKYTIEAVKKVCREFGGDEKLVFLAGFSRGAIGSNYIGLHDDEIAGLWCAFILFSHYDGVRDWGYEGADKASAVRRLERLRGRPQLIMQEGTGTKETKEFLESTGIKGNFTYLNIPYRNHNDKWVLQNIPERRFLRQWVADVIDYRKRE